MSPVPSLAGTPAGRQAAWFFEQAGAGVAPGSEELATRFEAGARVFGPPLDTDAGWEAHQRLLGSGQVGDVTTHSDWALDVDVTDDRGRAWQYRFRLDQSTGRTTELRLERVRDEEVTIRFATEADAAVLADIERRSPIVLGDVRVTIDRGDDYFAAARLMEDVAVVVAEMDGVPGAVHCAAAHPVRVGGQPYRLAYYHHLRILPEHQGKGLFGKLAEKLGERFSPSQVDGTYAYVSPDNAASQRLFSTATAWPVQPLLCELDVAKLSGPAAGQPATPADAPAIVETLNRCHNGEELWVPYTVESLTARLERAPAQYGWPNLWLGEAAVLGVWPAGESISIVVDGPQGQQVDREGVALDHGFLPGCQGGFEALLRAWCTTLGTRGFTKLMIFSSARSPSYPVLQQLGARMEPFDLYAFGPPVPEDASRRGVYVDHTCF